MLFDSIGFTGTQDGMTVSQLRIVAKILGRLMPAWVVHGDCVGADSEFHAICSALREENPGCCQIRIRPCDIDCKRQWNEPFDDIAPVKKPLDRNDDIVADALLLIGTPNTNKEVVRSGTWATIRRARKSRKPLVIVWPDGSVNWENLKKEVKDA